MPLTLAILAIVAAAAAILLAWRSSRASHRLALEMVQLRDRLTAAEAHYRELAEAAAHAPPKERAPDTTFAPRLEALEHALEGALEERLRTALAHQTRAAVPDAGEDPRERIRRALRKQGYTYVAFLPVESAAENDAAEADLLVEAEREGVMSKGRVALAADGSVSFRSVSSLRAFP